MMAENAPKTITADKDGVVINTKTMNLYQKMLAIENELPTVAKNLEVGVGQSSYKASGEADILRAVRPLEHKYGIYSYPYSREIVESGNIESERYNKLTKEKEAKKELFERIKVVYRFINVDNPTEHLDITSYGDGIDSADKSVGKAMTYADKYALMKAYKIITGEDPDQEASGDLKGADIKKEPLDKELVDKITIDYNFPLEKAAAYLRKTVDNLTNDDLRTLIARKEAKLKAEGGIPSGN